MATSVVPVGGSDPEAGGGEDNPPSSVVAVPTLLVGGKTYYHRPQDNSVTLPEICCPACCYWPSLVTFYASPDDQIVIGEKDGKKCCFCCTLPPKPPKGELHPGYQVRGKGTLNPWKRPCCFCLQQTPQMPDPSLVGQVDADGNPIPIPADKFLLPCLNKPGAEGNPNTYYIPTAIVKDNNGTPVFETRIRSADQNICAACKGCCKLECCKIKCCSLCCFACCGPCCDCCFGCSSCCKCKSCAGCCKPCCKCFACCDPCCKMACPACWLCMFGNADMEPTYTIEKQPIYRAGKDQKVPVGYIKSIWMENTPFSVTIDVPGATKDENELLLILAWAIAYRTDPEDISKVGFIHDTATNITNQYFTTLKTGVKFNEVLDLIQGRGGGAPDVSDMTR